MPAGPSGLDPGTNFNQYGVTGGNASTMVDRTQGTVTSGFGQTVSTDPNVTGAASIFGGLVDLVNSIAEGLASLITSIFGAITGIINAVAVGIEDVIGAIAGLIVGIFGAIGNVVNGIFNGLSGKDEVGVNWSDTGAQITSFRNTVVNMQSSIEAMKYDQLPQGGAIHVDEFDTGTTSGWGAGWTTGGTGSSHVDDTSFTGQVVWDRNGNVARQYGGYKADETLSDLQIVAVMLETGIAPPSPSANFMAGNLVRGRVGDGGNSFVYARLYYNQVDIGCVVDSTPTLWDSFTLASPPTSGGLLELQCGTEVDDDVFDVYLNRQPIAGYTDTAGLAKKGAGYRKGGMDMFSDVNALKQVGKSPVETPPGNVNRWSLRDLAPPGVTGTGLRVKRLSATGGIVLPASTNAPVPGDYFDTVDYCSTDLTWDTNTNTITITKDGMYSLKHSLDLGLTPPSSIKAFAGVWVNGVAEMGSSFIESGATMGNIVGNFDLALKAGDLVQPSAANLGTSDIQIFGLGTGELAWMTLTKVG